MTQGMLLFISQSGDKNSDAVLNRFSFQSAFCRDELLGQIRSGVTLKKVDLDSIPSIGSSDALPSGIAGMLQKALQERSGKNCELTLHIIVRKLLVNLNCCYLTFIVYLGALRFSSSEEDDDPDDDDEWDE